MLINPKDVKKIAIFRALQLGDLLCAVPAFRALREAYPQASITLLGLPWAATFVQRFNRYFDNFKHFPGFPGLPEQSFHAASTVSFLQEMNDEKYDLVLQMQGNGSIVNPLMELMGGKINAGFYRSDDYCPDSTLYLLYPPGVHEIERHLLLMDHLGIERKGSHLEFPLTENDHQELRNSELNLEQDSYVCVHPGSRGTWRQWPPAFFALLADICHEHGRQVIITGTKDEIEIAEEVANRMQHPSIIAAGKTTLGSMAALIQGAYAIISNCTGPAHIAAALRTRSIIISMDGEPERWTYQEDNLHFALDWTRHPDVDLAAKATELIFKPNLIEESDAVV
jgi:ADP-heptose:LPS heptosyltransferase